MILHIFHKIHSILLPCKMDSLYMSNVQYMSSVSVVCTVQSIDLMILCIFMASGVVADSLPSPISHIQR